MKPQTLHLRCNCGQVTGTLSNISAAKINRAVCYCKFCQAYQQHLDQAAKVLDAQGGTDVFQMSPRDIHFDTGVDQIDCINLTRSGALRFYAKCCNTALINTTQNLNIPFAGISTSAVEELRSIELRDDLLGTVRARVNGKSEDHLKLEKTGRLSLALMLFHLSLLMFIWKLRGDAKRSPLVSDSMKPIVKSTRVKLSK